jgi:hypothetical protein
MSKRATAALLVSILLGCCLASGLVFFIPPIHQRLSFQAQTLEARLRRALNPPEQALFVPGQATPGLVETLAQATLDVLLPSSTPTAPDSSTTTPTSPPTATGTPPPSPTPAPSPTPIPAQALLNGIRFEYQQFNNCGPANLSMALSYWGWPGDQRDTRAYLRPNLEVDDKNVMPEEMVAFVETQPGLKALVRVGGDLDLIKRLIAAGFPVIIEKGHDPADDWWMGHYMVINGYDDGRARFTAQDSLIMPDFPLPYEQLSQDEWRDFNYVYLLVFPTEREAEVLSLLGPHADQAYSYQHAAERARQEITLLEGRELFFAWFNLGSSLVGLGDANAAAQAYDEAFAIYAGLPEEERPYRLMWYQVGPYLAYYDSGRYEDVVALANTTFTWVGKPVLEESYFWRAMAYEALGNINQAISDYKKAAALNPNYTPAMQAVERLGIQLP